MTRRRSPSFTTGPCKNGDDYGGGKHLATCGPFNKIYSGTLVLKHPNDTGAAKPLDQNTGPTFPQ